MSDKILVTHELRSYRESVGIALAQLKPDWDVIVMEPSELDSGVLAMGPRVVICGTLTEVVQTRCPVWILLYPDGERQSMVSVDGEISRLPSIEFKDILQTVERAGTLDTIS